MIVAAKYHCAQIYLDLIYPISGFEPAIEPLYLSDGGPLATVETSHETSS